MGEVGSFTKSSYLIVMVEETELFSFFDAKLRPIFSNLQKERYTTKLNASWAHSCLSFPQSNFTPV